MLYIAAHMTTLGTCPPLSNAVSYKVPSALVFQSLNLMAINNKSERKKKQGEQNTKRSEFFTPRPQMFCRNGISFLSLNNERDSKTGLD